MRTHKKPRFFTKLFHWFTLVELIVVISVLAVLASIAMSQISNITAWARDSQRMTDMSAMKSSIELYKAKTGKLPIPTNGSGVTYSWGLLWTQGTFGEPTWRQLNSITPKPVDPNNAIEYVYSVANNNREFELGGILEKATWFMPSILNEVLAASQNVTFIEWTYNGISLKVETGSKTYVVAAPSLIGGYLGDAKMENTGLTIEGLWSLPKGFSGVVVSTAQTGTFTPVVAWSGTTLPETATWAEALIIGLQSSYTGTVATGLSQISSLVNATGSQITSLGEGLIENALGGEISGQSNSGGGNEQGETCTYCNSGSWSYIEIARAWLTAPRNLAYASGYIYVMNASRGVVSRVFTTWGAYDFYTYSYPMTIAYDEIRDYLYVTNQYNSLSQIMGTGSFSAVVNPYPQDLEVSPSWDMYSIVWPTIYKMTRSGVYSLFYTPSGNVNWGWFDKAGNLYVAQNDGVYKITLDGVSSLFSPVPYGQDVVVDKIGNLFVSSSTHLYKITPDGVSSIYALSSPWYKMTIDRNTNKIYMIYSGGVFKVTPI